MDLLGGRRIIYFSQNQQGFYTGCNVAPFKVNMCLLSFFFCCHLFLSQCRMCSMLPQLRRWTLCEPSQVITLSVEMALTDEKASFWAPQNHGMSKNGLIRG